MSLELVEYVLLVVGITYLVTQASITSFVRRPLARRLGVLGAGLYCAACTGFWTGVGLGLADHAPFEHGHFVLDVVVSGVCAMGLGHLWQHGTGGNPMYGIEQEEALSAPQKES